MNQAHIALLLQYALAAAAQEDPGSQELGPIHLLKYVYLGDLAYSEEHDGQTYTGAPWRFHHFGPWAVPVFQEIPAALEAVGARQRSFQSRYKEEDARRWRLADASVLERLEREVPREAARAIRNAVHQFGSDTSVLLHYVYCTPPMLHAAPGELLDFHGREPQPAAPRGEASLSETAPISVTPVQAFSKTALKKLKARVQEKLQQKRTGRLMVPEPSPRYDVVYLAGVEWLDRLAGEPAEPAEGTLSFSGAVWKSAARGDRDLP